MLERFNTVQRHGTAEIVIKRSRFIGHAKPVETEEEAMRFVDEISKQHRLAKHNCYAYVVGERDQWQKQSDDGEPSGTAGKPILEVIKHRALKNVVVVVTRYFGGIMLGAGGLVRAYTDGAVAGIDAAIPVSKVLHKEVKVEIDYTWLGKLENELHMRQIRTGETTYTDKVVLSCLPVCGETERFIEWIRDLTQGQGNIIEGDCLYYEE